MPCLDCGSPKGSHGHRWCNGGIPQLANTTAHVEAMERDMAARVPANYSGWVVHDWEAWVVPWELSGDGHADAGGRFQAYQNASVALARFQNPSASEAELEKIAAAAYTKAGIDLLVLTVRTTKRLRPGLAGVGYYGLPHKQYWPAAALNKTQQGWNDQLLPLWKEVTAILPSLYMPYESDCSDSPVTNNTGGCVPFAHNKAYVKAGIAEAVRISKLVTPSPPVVPYVWYLYHGEPMPDPHADQLLTKKDAVLQFHYPLTRPGVEQLIIWGDDHHNASEVAALKAWFKTNAAAFLDAGQGDDSGGDGTGEHQESAEGGHEGTSVATAKEAGTGAGAPRPPIPRDGPIPPYTGCTL
jgi:hypothetical protein